jgi:hypothetical protein
MIYQVQDTPEGFRLIVKESSGKLLYRTNFDGSHNAVAEAYAILERVHTGKNAHVDSMDDTIERARAFAEIFASHEFGMYSISAILADGSRVVLAYDRETNRQKRVYVVQADGSFVCKPGDDSLWEVPEA